EEDGGADAGCVPDQIVPREGLPETRISDLLEKARGRADSRAHGDALVLVEPGGPGTARRERTDREARDEVLQLVLAEPGERRPGGRKGGQGKRKEGGSDHRPAP